MVAGLVDFHSHLDLYPDHASAVLDCEREEIHTLAVTTTPKAWPRNRDLASKTTHVRAALGLHPQLVAERPMELTLWQEYLPQTRYVGEVGLDAGPRFFRSLDLQKRVFEEVLKACAHAGGKILSVHSVRAITPVLDMIEANLPPHRSLVVLHWFTGSTAEARRAVNLGCFFSINAEMLRTTRHHKLVRALPVERILTETDGPFTKHEEHPAHPRDTRAAVDALAHVLGADSSNVADMILANLRRLESGVREDLSRKGDGGG